MTAKNEPVGPKPPDPPEPITDVKLDHWHAELQRLLGWHGLPAMANIDYYKRTKQVHELANSATSALTALGRKMDVDRDTILAVQGLAAELRDAAQAESGRQSRVEYARRAAGRGAQQAELERLQHERPDLYPPPRIVPTMAN